MLYRLGGIRVTETCHRIVQDGGPCQTSLPQILSQGLCLCIDCGFEYMIVCACACVCTCVCTCVCNVFLGGLVRSEHMRFPVVSEIFLSVH